MLGFNFCVKGEFETEDVGCPDCGHEQIVRRRASLDGNRCGRDENDTQPSSVKFILAKVEVSLKRWPPLGSWQPHQKGI